ncbi:hypothetical protein [Promicromonospora sp. NPDC023805]|uniref:hypothetical protein n=1 Tax=Promicromonospora sp. NPDC023805 TaxID=3154696 RepID=UPI0033E55013
MTNSATPEGLDTKDDTNGPRVTTAGVTTVALAVLVAGSLLERFAGVDSAYIGSRIVAAPIILVALAIGIRRRTGRALIWPAILLVLVAATFVAEVA